MTIAYVIASIVLCLSIVFSYQVLRKALDQQAHLNELTSVTAQLQLVIRNSAFHMAELKEVKYKTPPGSRLEFKIKEKLDKSRVQILELSDRIQSKLSYFERSGLHEEISPLFTIPQRSLLTQLENYSNRLSDLALNKDNQTPGIYLLWLPVEAAAAFDGSLVIAMRQAQARLQEIVTQRSEQLSATHTRLSWFAVFVVFLELILIFIPLNQLLKNTNKRLLRANNDLYIQANFDTETGLGNRTAMIESLTSRHASSMNNGVLTVRIKDTDKVHNIAGPAATGQVFEKLALRLQSQFGAGDCVFRTGDTEFSVFVYNEAQVSDPAIVRTIQTELAHPLDVGNVKIYPHLALGYDSGLNTYDDATDRLVNARLAAVHYDISKPVVPHYDESMRARIDNEIFLVEKMRKALANKEFVPFYQIKVDTNTGEACGMEALCRWIQADGTRIKPSEFIPVAENSGLIAELTWQMLEQVVDDWNRWQELGLNPGRIAFNAAQGFLMDDGCCSRFATLTASMRSDTCPIDLEITENVALSETNEQVITVLDNFRQMGMSIALDDFGTGFASLSSIVNMDIDVIKVDQHFVREMTQCKDSLNIVITILNLCKLLDKKSVVEGIETEEQWQLCRSLGCNEIQGFYFSRPTDFDSVSLLLPRAESLNASAAS